jgi:hypothetical protein
MAAMERSVKLRGEPAPPITRRFPTVRRPTGSRVTAEVAARWWCRGSGTPIEQNSLPQVFGWSWGDGPKMEQWNALLNLGRWKVVIKSQG